MPKVNGPLFSLRASGTLGKTLTFGTLNDQPIVRRHVIPADPSTPAMQLQRQRVANIAAGWGTLDTLQQSAWNTAAAAYQMNGYAYFLQQYHFQGCTPPELPSIP